MEKYNIEKFRSENATDFNSNYELEDAYLRAKKRVDKIKGFYWHLFWYVVVNIFLISMIIIRLDEGESIWKFNHFSTAFFWGIGILFHLLGTFGTNVFFSKEWEKKQIDKFIDKEKRRWE